MIHITPRQFECLRLLIMARHARRNITMRHIGQMMNIASPNGVMEHLKRLAHKGLVTKNAKQTPVVDCPYSMCLPYLGAIPCKREDMLEDCYLLLGPGVEQVVAVREWQPEVN